MVATQENESGGRTRRPIAPYAGLTYPLCRQHVTAAFRTSCDSSNDPEPHGHKRLPSTLCIPGSRPPRTLRQSALSPVGGCKETHLIQVLKRLPRPDYIVAPKCMSRRRHFPTSDDPIVKTESLAPHLWRRTPTYGGVSTAKMV